MRIRSINPLQILLMKRKKKYESLNSKAAGIGGDKIYNSTFKVGETRDIEF